MYWNRHEMNGWNWFAMSISTVLLWALLITVAVLLYRTLNRSPEPPHTPAATPAEQVLAERFARGEIDEEEYRRRLTVLRGNGPNLAKH
ncbi:SHOCT domain-containing protein [Streptomyces sp. NBC_01451]|uniref:SHOCT domain-containing protein n=1 Tax=Streptomyces sp. NBC_01451 TaxID=2903872 RepID=UPI002E31BC54|nr:SHOCT domain-containing protein [Streptomyces sp. NBC_01451]